MDDYKEETNELQKPTGTLKVITDLIMWSFAGLELHDKENLSELKNLLFSSSDKVDIRQTIEKMIGQVLEDCFNWRVIEIGTFGLGYYPDIAVEIIEQIKTDKMSDDDVEKFLFDIFDKVGKELGLCIAPCPRSWSFERNDMNYYETKEGISFFGAHGN